MFASVFLVLIVGSYSYTTLYAPLEYFDDDYYFNLVKYQVTNNH